MTALTIYGTSVAASTVTTAAKFIDVAGGTSAAWSSKIAKLTGYGQLYALGNTGTWPALGSIGAPDGHGFLWDVTTLEGQQFSGGTWTPTIKLSASSACTADIIFRAYKRSSGGVYTAIGSITLSGQSISTSATTYSLAATALTDTSFSTGDKLYGDVWLNITVASGSNTATVNLFESTTGTAGVASQMQVVTPGYTPAATTTTYSFEDDLVAVESLLAGDGALPQASLSAADALLSTETDLPLDGLSATDIGGLFRWPVDALVAAESLQVAETALPLEGLAASESLLLTGSSGFIEANSAGDALRTGGSSLLTESLATADALLSSGASLLLDALTAGDAALDSDTYAAKEALAADDSASTMAESSPGLVTTTYSFVEALATNDGVLWGDAATLTEGNSAADSLLHALGTSAAESLQAGSGLQAGDGAVSGEALVGVSRLGAGENVLAIEGNVASDSLTGGTGGGFIENLSASDGLLKQDGYGPVDALSASAFGALQRFPVENLTAADAFVSAESYQATDVQSVLESLQAGEGAAWVELLAASDVFSALAFAPAPVQYSFRATATTRDMQATARTRDSQASAVARDELAQAQTRDELATATTRDMQAVAHTHG